MTSRGLLNLLSVGKENQSYSSYGIYSKARTLWLYTVNITNLYAKNQLEKLK